MYRVISNIDSKFKSLHEALEYYDVSKPILPTIPSTCSPEENKTVKRICCAEDIRDCLTSIGLLGRFRRCLAANEDAKSYETEGSEIYPVLVLKFPDDVEIYKPSLSEVPDCDITNERWILKPTIAEYRQVRWLGMRSIKFVEAKSKVTQRTIYKCVHVDWVDKNMPDAKHPWLNGKGHVLDCSLMEDEFEE